MQDYQIRVIEEKDQLNEKFNKLRDFMYTHPYAALPAVEQGLLMVQLEAMESYQRALSRRIERFD